MESSELPASDLSRQIAKRGSRSPGGLSRAVGLDLVVLGVAAFPFAAACSPKLQQPAAKTSPLPDASDAVRKSLKGPFLVANGGDLYIFDAFGVERRITEVPISQGALIKDPAWSPDGKQIVYSYTPPPDKSAERKTLVAGAELWLMDAKGANQRQLLKDQEPSGRLEQPTWAADGASILYTYFKPIYSEGRFVDTEVSIERLDLQSMKRSLVAKDSGYPSVSRDGKSLVYLRLDPEASGPSLVVQDMGGSPKELIKEGEFVGLAYPRISPDGKKIAFAASGEHVPTAGQSSPKSKGGALRWPKVVSVAEANGLPWDVWTIDMDGAGLKRITKLGEDSPSLGWSPDGRYVGVLGIFGLYLVNADGSGAARISPKGALHGQLAWGP